MCRVWQNLSDPSQTPSTPQKTHRRETICMSSLYKVFQAQAVLNSAFVYPSGVQAILRNQKKCWKPWFISHDLYYLYIPKLAKYYMRGQDMKIFIFPACPLYNRDGNDTKKYLSFVVFQFSFILCVCLLTWTSGRVKFFAISKCLMEMCLYWTAKSDTFSSLFFFLNSVSCSWQLNLLN